MDADVDARALGAGKGNLLLRLLASRAERPGVSTLRLIEPADLIRPGQARELTEARERSGHDPGELASLLGITFEGYRDLEWFDEEIVDTISFAQLLLLARAIDVDLRAFFDARGVGRVEFDELARRLRVERERDPELEDRVGWELGRVLDDPSAFAELPAIALADMGEAVGVDWRSLLPHSTAERPS
jgi:hypothetical protein